MEHVSRYVTPTYHSNLNAAIRDVVTSLNNSLQFQAWEALQTLHSIAPPAVEKECDGSYRKIQLELAKVIGDKQSDDLLLARGRQRATIIQVLRLHNRAFLRTLINSLFKHGYLEKPARVIPVGTE